MSIADFVTFDFAALQRALDRERRARDLSWAAVSKSTRPTGGPTSRRVSPTTLSRIGRQRNMEADGVLTVLAWLGATFEAFTRRRIPHTTVPYAPAQAPHLDDCLRFDPRLIHRALDERRSERGLGWLKVSAEIGATRPGNLTRLARGGRLGVPSVLHIADWLERAPETLATPANW
jgi:hypothetical protein